MSVHFLMSGNITSLLASGWIYAPKYFHILVQREQRGVAPADCWNCGEWGLKEYKWKRFFLGWFVGIVVSVQETFILPWLLCSALYKISFSSPYTISIYVSPCPAPWTGSRAGPPVSECVSPFLSVLLALNFSSRLWWPIQGADDKLGQFLNQI